MKKLTMTLCLGLTLFWASSACAILIDPYDNFLAPDGFYGLLYGNYYSADELTGSNGDKVADFDLTATVTVLRGINYFKLGKFNLAAQLIIPFGEVKEEKLLNESSSGVGDIIFGPGVFLYADQTEHTYLSYWFYAFAPTGEWDQSQVINLGQNHWYFEHQLAFAKMMGNFVYDMNLNYYQHTEESDNNYTAPDRFELEASLIYQINENIALGVNGGGYWDLDEGEINDVAVADTKLQRIQFGPTIAYTFNNRLTANLRWTHDLSSENDSKGDDVWARLAYAF